MKLLPLGQGMTQVSRLSLGTVELGLPYGVRLEGESALPTKNEAIDLILGALDLGINFLDTAPDYGTSESIIGEALARTDRAAHIATKVQIPQEMTTDEVSKQKIRDSVLRSLERLKVDCIKLLQIHNATAEDLVCPGLVEVFQDLREQGLVESFGASIYDQELMPTVVQNNTMNSIQVPFSLIDRRFGDGSLVNAVSKKVTPIIRSIFLKGALTPRYRKFPTELSALCEHIRMIEDWGVQRGLTLPELALRFVFSFNKDSVLLVGAKHMSEIEEACRAVRGDGFSQEDMASLCGFGLEELSLIDPRYWPKLG